MQEDSKGEIRLDAGVSCSEQAALWQRGLLCDVLLVGASQHHSGPDALHVGHPRPLAAHRLVLAAASGFFRAQFTGAGTSMRPLPRPHPAAAASPQEQPPGSPYSSSCMADGPHAADVVELPGIDHETLRTAVAAMYERTIVITPDNLEPVLAASSYLEAPCLIQACCQYMSGALELQNAVPLLTLAGRYGCLALRAELLDFIKAKFSSLLILRDDDALHGCGTSCSSDACPAASLHQEQNSDWMTVGSSLACLARSEGWIDSSAGGGQGGGRPAAFSVLSRLSKDLMLELLVSDDLAVDCERDVLLAVVDWVALAPTVRLGDLPELVAAVRIDLLSADLHLGIDSAVHAMVLQHARDIIAHQRAVMRSCHVPTSPSYSGCSSSTCHTAASVPASPAAFSAVALPPPESRGRPRRLLATSLLAAGGHDAAWRMFRSVEVYDPHDDVWSLGPPLAAGVSFASSAALGREVFLFGGNPMCPAYFSRLPSGAGQVWEPCLPLPTPRAHVGMAACSGLLYVLGGRSQVQQVQRVLSSAHVYDPRTTAWTDLRDMSVPRSALAAATLGGAVYAVGGQAAKGVLSTVERYDPGTERWAVLEHDMRSERKYTAAGVVGGRLVVVGGVNETRSRLASAEALDPREGQWRALAPMRLPRSSAGAAVLHDKLYVVGGHSADDVVLSDVECYVPAADRWLPCAPLGCGRSSLGLCAV